MIEPTQMIRNSAEQQYAKLTYKINSLRYMHKNQSEDTMEEKTPFRIAMTPK